MGGGIGGLFGMGSSPKYEAPAPVEHEPAPVRDAEVEPESRAVRDDERRRIKSRRAMNGTLLTSPLGTGGQRASGLLGANLN